MASSDIQIAKPQRGCPERAELPDVNINTGAQSINSERASQPLTCLCLHPGTQLIKLPQIITKKYLITQRTS